MLTNWSCCGLLLHFPGWMCCCHHATHELSSGQCAVVCTFCSYCCTSNRCCWTLAATVQCTHVTINDSSKHVCCFQARARRRHKLNHGLRCSISFQPEQQMLQLSYMLVAGSYLCLGTAATNPLPVTTDAVHGPAAAPAVQSHWEINPAPCLMHVVLQGAAELPHVRSLAACTVRVPQL
jgi:hypothetical protein